MKTAIKLQGGLGNLLFQKAYGNYLYQKYDINVSFIFMQPKHNSHEVGLRFLESIAGEIDISQVRSITNSAIVLQRKVSSKFPRGASLISNLTRTYTPIEIGYLRQNEEKSIGRLSEGYFQSWMYVNDDFKLSVKENLEKKQSDSFKSYIHSFDLSKDVVIHVRRGDYVDKSSYHGLLSLDYYENAIQEMIGTSTQSLIHVVTDDLSNTKLLFSNSLYKGRIRYFQPSNKSSVVDSLNLMICAKKLIIANSSFSWWGAFLDSDKSVLAPKKWFKSNPNPALLLPANWKTQESNWV